LQMQIFLSSFNGIFVVYIKYAVEMLYLFILNNV